LIDLLKEYLVQVMQIIQDVTGAVATGLLLLAAAMIDVSDPLIVTAGTAMFAMLSGAIKLLWDRNNTLANKTDAALSRCEEEHHRAAAKYEADQKQAVDKMNTLVNQVIALSGEVGLMKGRIQGFQEATEKADNIARDKVSHEHPVPSQHEHIHHNQP
jgi:hypothetical protein